jgi:serine/threonine protein kinase/tetratricopeptide (TPR) repeat protein
MIGQYRIMQLLGEGGMGKVYLAEDCALRRLVAVKVLSDEIASQPDKSRRFLREARAMAALEHPHIIRIHAFGEEAGKPYFAMQYVEGEDLAERIHRKERLEIEEALRIVDQIADALEAAWSKALIHRDLKPGNILLDANDQVIVADFGLAKTFGKGEGKKETTLTETGNLVGTPAYMSPEQARSEKLDFRSDIYSLGIILYEMLCGVKPFRGETPVAIIVQHLHEPLPSLRKVRLDLGESLEKLVAWMTHKRPDERPPSYNELRLRLRQLIDKDDSGLMTPELEGIGLSTISTALKRVTSVTEETSDWTALSCEQRHATVLSVEISTVDRSSDEPGSEEAAIIANRILDRFASIALNHQGFVTGISDGIITVLFGVPAACEEAPKEAVNSAIAMRNEFLTMANETRSVGELHFRAGIGTGTVIVETEGNLRNYSYSGEALETAAMLRSVAPEGQICAGEATHLRTHAEFRYRIFKSIVQSDRRQPRITYELLSNREKLHRSAERQGIIRSEMVGRENETNKLQLHVMKLIEGQGSVVSVLGDAGIGKSRLVAELQAFCRDRRVVFLEGRSVSQGRNLSFHPITDILKHWAAIYEQDGNLEAENKLRRVLTRICADRAEEMLPFIAALMGLKPIGRQSEQLEGMPGDILTKMILKNLRDLIATASRMRPLMLVFEDLHWADISTIEFLESLYRMAKNHPILFVNVLRPGFPDTGDRILQMLKAFGPLHEAIVLKPLTHSQCEILMRNLLQVENLSPEIKEMVVRKVGGNPFFLEEVGRSFIDEGIIVKESGGFRLSKKADQIFIPETIQDVLLARLDRLDDATRELVRTASVIGRRFLYRILVRVAETVPDIDMRLQYLEASQLVEKRATQGDFEYVFKHVMVQEVSYDSILNVDRRALHSKVGKAIEDIYSHRINQFYGMLALHYCLAEEMEKAEEFMIKAGEEALRSATSTEALHYYSSALEIYLNKRGSHANPDKVAMLERNIALALYNRGQYSEAVRFFNKVLECYGVPNPQNRFSLAWNFSKGMGDFLFSVHFPFLKFRRQPSVRDSQIIHLYYRKLAALAHEDPHRFFLESFILAQKLTPFDLQKVDNGVGMFTSTGNLLAWTGISFYLSEKVLRLMADQVSDAGIRSQISYAAAEVTHNFFSGTWRSIYDDDLLQQAINSGEIFFGANYLIFHGRTALGRGEFSDANWYVQMLYELGDQYEHEYPLTLYHYLRSKLLVTTRRLAEALNACNEAIDFIEATHLGTLVCGVYALKARALLWLGEVEEAEETIRAADEARRRVRVTPCYQGDYLHSRCLMDLQYLGDAKLRNEGSARQAKTSCREYLRNSRRVASCRTEAHRLLGWYYWLVNDVKRAFSAWEAGIQTGTQIGASVDLARTYMDIGNTLPKAGLKFSRTKLSASECIERSHFLLQKTGADPDQIHRESLN